jgi:hypothetical protein
MTVQAYHNRVAELPAVAKRYEKEDKPPRVSYKPLP